MEKEERIPLMEADMEKKPVYPYINQTKPWTFWQRIRLFFRPMRKLAGAKVKIMDGILFVYELGG